MKCQIIIGSPRKNGNTFVLSNYLNDMLTSSNINSNMSFLYDYEIKPCIDCRACKKGELKCSIKDDTEILYKQIEKSDLIVFGTPIYWFGPTAKTKLLIDRLRPYYTNKKLSGKKAAVILAAGSGAGDCDLTIEMFKRIFDALGIGFIGSAISKSYDIGDAAADQNAIDEIQNLWKMISSLKE